MEENNTTKENNTSKAIIVIVIGVLLVGGSLAISLLMHNKNMVNNTTTTTTSTSEVSSSEEVKTSSTTISNNVIENTEVNNYNFTLDGDNKYEITTDDEQTSYTSVGQHGYKLTSVTYEIDLDSGIAIKTVRDVNANGSGYPTTRRPQETVNQVYTKRMTDEFKEDMRKAIKEAVDNPGTGESYFVIKTNNSEKRVYNTSRLKELFNNLDYAK